MVDVVERALASQHIAYSELQFARLAFAEGVDILAMELVLQACEIFERWICHLPPNLLEFLLFRCEANEFLLDFENFLLLAASLEPHLRSIVRTAMLVTYLLKGAIKLYQRLDG